MGRPLFIGEKLTQKRENTGEMKRIRPKTRLNTSIIASLMIEEIRFQKLETHKILLLDDNSKQITLSSPIYKRIDFF